MPSLLCSLCKIPLIALLFVTFEAQANVDFTDVFDRHNAVMMLLDPRTGEIVRANQGAEQFYGYSKTELSAMKIQDINQLDAAQVKAEMALAKSEGRNFFTFLHRLKSGENRTVHVSSIPVEFEGRKLLFSVITDVTISGEVALNSAAHYQRMLEQQVAIKVQEVKARSDQLIMFALVAGLVFFFASLVIARMAMQYRRASLDLSASEKRLNEIIWSTNVGTWEWGVISGEVQFNEQWAKLLGYTLDELKPHCLDTWESRVHPDDVGPATKALQAVLKKEKEKYRVEYRIRHKDGHWVWHQATWWNGMTRGVRSEWRARKLISVIKS